MALEDFRTLLDQKRVSVGGGKRVPPRHEMMTSPARRFVRRQRDIARIRGRKM